MASYTFPQQRISSSKKGANKSQWAKDVLDEIDRDNQFGVSGRSSSEQKAVNYNLFNGVLDEADFEYVCKPYGNNSVGEMPAELRHYDIISPKLRVLFGEEIKRPFNFKAVATNSEAITEKEREQKKLLDQYVQQQIQLKIQQAMQEAGISPDGKPADAEDPEAVQQTQQQIQQITQAMTPPEIQEYMQRDYQANVEIMANQMLMYLKKKERVRDKFNKGWKHALIAGEEIYWTGIVNGEPEVRVVNPLYFEYDKDPDIDNIQNSQWAKYIMRMTPGSVIDTFGEYMSATEIDNLYSGTTVAGTANPLGSPEFNYDYDQDVFSGAPGFDATSFNGQGGSDSYIRVVHAEWKSLRKIGFLTFLDPDTMQEEEMVVDESYKMNPESGDVDIRWEWIPEIWEGTKIGNDVYVNMRPKPNQFRDIDNLYTAKLGYVGVAYNNLNAQSISMIDRMKPYQYLYNIMMYRLEMDLASDKGKKFLADISQIPSSMGMDMEKWLYYFDALGIAFVNPNEEGNRNKQSNFNQWQSIDLSMGQTISQKVQLLEYLESQCGEVSGVTKQRQGQVGPNELVGNTQSAVAQSSYITEEWFYQHNTIKGYVLEALIDVAKVAWGDGKAKKLQYILDDMTIQMLTIDPVELPNSSFGVFVSDSAKDQELFLTLRQLSHAALQNQQAELSDVIKMFSTDSVSEIKTLLESSEKQRRDREAQQQQQVQQSQAQQQQAQQQAQMQIETQKAELEKAKLELEKYKTDANNETKLAVAEINSFKNQMDQDINDNGVPDQLEIEKLKIEVVNQGKKAEIENRKLDIKEKELGMKDAQEAEKREQEAEKRRQDSMEKAKDRKAKKKS